ncbi:hypothetical protein DSL72_003494 [Monilinia vaccinii-corymbosi]|uniref:Alpha-type protein kinase domain-containing protein n=1 Tax=Monilinia vaccinii-corymbosi TaxID=61207 RepID=A0A8A3NTG0_9HELO|nr:hypothetical protein DSL72_003494 [Monilinia vaccinii-corymbosi]
MSHQRTNNATEAEIDLTQIFASGTFKNVWAGTYTKGERRGQACVSKEFKTGSVVEAHYFDEELHIIRRAQEIIDHFHAANIIRGRNIILNTPSIWTYTGGSRMGHKSLMEPMIENFEKFNSNTGWTGRQTIWNDAIQALSHFSYHDSNRRFLLCDLQGGSYSDGYVLSDPVVMSQEQDCGPADLGPDGIRSFFLRHRCGRFCKHGWDKPEGTGRAAIPMRQGTSMGGHLGTRQSRNPLSRLQE